MENKNIIIIVAVAVVAIAVIAGAIFTTGALNKTDTKAVS